MNIPEESILDMISGYVAPMELQISKSYLKTRSLYSSDIPITVRGQKIPEDIFQFSIEIYPNMLNFLKYHEVVNSEADEVINNFLVFMISGDTPKYKEFNPRGKQKKQEFYQFWFFKLRYFRNNYYKSLLNLSKLDRDEKVQRVEGYRFEEIPVYKYQPDQIYRVTEFKNFLKTYYPKEFEVFEVRMQEVLTYSSIATKLGVSLSTIEKRLSTLKKLVTKFFNPSFSGDLQELI